MTFNPEGKTKVDDMLSEAAAHLRSNDIEGALRKLVDSIMYDKHAHDELARKACIAIFHHLGEQHELTKVWRRRFSMALY
ncbi:MAG: tetratricopeptide repeat protein [Thermaurantimonas aggregans]|nr:tetratricopeptide repeat protein [Thermaurantimonas aggregans]MCX8148694.1 tetratricopeptide repeat protein [Thermaurantimonas aggregans]